MAAGAAWRIALPLQTISHLYGLNFDFATSSETFNCTNIFFDPYLPIHHTTFMALRFVLRPFSLSIPNARVVSEMTYTVSSGTLNSSIPYPMQGVLSSKFF